MAVGVMRPDPITSERAVIRIESADVADCKFKDRYERAQKQFACEMKVLSGAEERDGETFLEWLSFVATGDIGAGSKCGQVLHAALGDHATAQTLEELAEKLVGTIFIAKIGTSQDGQYPRIQHNTILPAPRGGASSGSGSPGGDGLPKASQAANEAPPLDDADEPEWESLEF